MQAALRDEALTSETPQLTVQDSTTFAEFVAEDAFVPGASMYYPWSGTQSADLGVTALCTKETINQEDYRGLNATDVIGERPAQNV